MIGERRSGRFFTPGLVAAAIATTLAACNQTYTGSAPTTAPTVQSINVGEELPRGATVRIETSGDYLIAERSTTLLTTCSGSITIDIIRDGAEAETHTCEAIADGTFTLVVSIVGAIRITVTLGDGAIALVTAS